MNTKQENMLKELFSFVGEAKGRMTLSVILAVIGEIFGMADRAVVHAKPRHFLYDPEKHTLCHCR